MASREFAVRSPSAPSAGQQSRIIRPARCPAQCPASQSARCPASQSARCRARVPCIPVRTVPCIPVRSVPCTAPCIAVRTVPCTVPSIPVRTVPCTVPASQSARCPARCPASSFSHTVPSAPPLHACGGPQVRLSGHNVRPLRHSPTRAALRPHFPLIAFPICLSQSPKCERDRRRGACSRGGSR